MAATNIICVVPKLKGSEDYGYWRVQMETHLKANDLNRFVEELIGDDVYMATQRRDSLALSQIHQAIDVSIFWRVSKARKAKEAWDILERTFGGVNHSQENGLFFLKNKFEHATMEKNETIYSYFSRLIEIKADMELYRHSMADNVFVEKVLSSLRPEFAHVVTVIQEIKDLSTLTPRDLLASLQVHEQRIKERIQKRDNGFQDSNGDVAIVAIGFGLALWLTIAILIYK